MDYGKIAKDYDSRYTSDMCKEEDESVKIWLEGVCRFADEILDVGCGTGYAVDLTSKIQPNFYTGIDASEEMVSIAKKKHPHYTFLHKKAEDIMSTGRYDTALCLFSIPYIGKKAVQAIHRALKSDGRVMCVYYEKPYLNPSSVYGGRKLWYKLTVAWRVKAVMKEFDKYFIKLCDYPLTKSQTYKVAVYQKKARNKNAERNDTK